MIEVQVKGTGDTVQFPDDMTDEQIRQVLQRQYGAPTFEQNMQRALTPLPNQARPYEPSMAESTGQAIADYLFENGIVSDRYGAQQVGENLSSILGVFPGVGDAQAGDELGAAIAKGDTGGAILAGVGAIPVVGDAAKAGVKGVSNLYKGHNVTVGGLRKAEELGGIPVPSLAIASKDAPLENFGDISLIGEKGSFAGDPTFASDVYSPRFPSTKVEIKQKPLHEEIKRLSESVDPRIESNLDARLSSQALGEDLERLDRSKANKQAFLQSIGAGVDPDDYVTAPEPFELPDWYKNLGMDETTVYTLSDMDNPEFVSRATEFAESVNPEKDIAEWWDGGELTKKAKRDILKDFRQVRMQAQESKPKFDGAEMHREIDRRVKDNTDKYDEYLREQKARIAGDRYFDVWNPDTATSKKVSYNLRNAVKLMRGNIRGGENFSYGAGNIRSQVTPELKSIEQIMDNRGKIVPADQMTLVKEEIDSELSNLYDSLSGNWAWDSEPSFSEFVDELSTAAKGDMSGFKDLSPEQQQELAAFFNTLKEAPTEYFEIKPQRAVDVSEFYGAAVPKGTPKDVVDSLKTKGLEVEFYEGEGRKEAIDRLNKKSGGNIFFSAGGAAILFGASRDSNQEETQ